MRVSLREPQTRSRRFFGRKNFLTFIIAPPLHHPLFFQPSFLSSQHKFTMVQSLGRRPQSLHEALLTLDTQALDLARDHLNDDPPPPYSSGGNTHLSSEPSADDRQTLERELERTRPESQFHQEAHDELEVIERAIERDKLLDNKLRPSLEIAMAVVRERWIEQGIWAFDDGRPHCHSNWKHSIADLGYYSDSTAPKRAQGSNIFGHSPFEGRPEPVAQPPDPPPDVDASRPCNRFEHDLREEQQRLETGEQLDGVSDMIYGKVRERWTDSGLWSSHFTQQPEHDLGKVRHQLWLEKRPSLPAPGLSVTGMAYESVKANWIQNGRWDSRWTDRPGRIWRHEQPEEMARLQQLGGLPVRGALGLDGFRTAGLKPLSPPTGAAGHVNSSGLGHPPAAADMAEPGASATTGNTMHRQPPSPLQRRTSRRRQPPTSLAGSLRVSKSKRKPDNRCQRNTVRNSAIPERQSLTRVQSLRDEMRPPAHSKAILRIATAPRRSARIAEQTRKAEEAKKERGALLGEQSHGERSGERKGRETRSLKGISRKKAQAGQRGTQGRVSTQTHRITKRRK